MVRSPSATSSMTLVSVARLSSTASVSAPPSSYLYKSMTSVPLRLFSPVHPPSSAVAAFLLFRFLSCGTFPSFHLPKVRGIPAFFAHLPKVRNRPGPSVGPVRAFLFPAASSHLPKVCSFPAFFAHLPKVRNRAGPSVAPVPAFSFPATFSHLPKVRSFPAFSAHLPKVRNRLGSSVAPVSAFPFPATFSHFPKVCGFPAFLLTFRRWVL